MKISISVIKWPRSLAVPAEQIKAFIEEQHHD